MRKDLFLLLFLCLLVLTSCAGDGSSSSQPTPATHQPGNDLPSPTTQQLTSLLQTEKLVLATPLPTSDLYNLAQRLGTSVTQLGPRVSRTSPLNEKAGQERNFWLYNQDTQTYSQTRARLVYVTAHTYMYVEDSQPFNQTALQLSANTFEQQIYTNTRALFGSEWTPGIDDDVHLTILNAVGLGNNVGGTFLVGDEYPTSVDQYSNQREMFYMNLDGEIPGSADYNSTLANELQHLINWHEHPLTFDWLDNGMALLAQHMNNYSVNGADLAFQQSPDTQLNDWSNDPTQQPAYAGASYLFLSYFASHYGGYSILKEVLQDPAAPPTNFDDVLAKHGYSERFNDVVRNWLVANFIADPSIDSGEYGYPATQLPGATPQQVISTYPYAQTDQVNQYAAEYYDLHFRSGQHTLSIQFTGSPTVRLVGNDPSGSADEWWGNRANNLDSTLTHSFDLSKLKGQHATLQFTTWFDMEQNHDYAYVEVSTDGGKHWVTLKSTDTTSSNPDGLNQGNGYTGISGNGTTPAWIEQSLNLTPYAGKKIQLRFEEVTDQSINLQGFAIDQIRIPELNFQDDLTTDNGWISNGFIRSNNILPEHYQVQAIVYTGSTFTVQNINVDLASGQGTLSIPHFGSSVNRVVLVVSAYAPETTLQAHYQLNIRSI